MHSPLSKYTASLAGLTSWKTHAAGPSSAGLTYERLETSLSRANQRSLFQPLSEHADCRRCAERLLSGSSGNNPSGRAAASERQSRQCSLTAPGEGCDAGSEVFEAFCEGACCPQPDILPKQTSKQKKSSQSKTLQTVFSLYIAYQAKLPSAINLDSLRQNRSCARDPVVWADPPDTRN